MEEKQYIKLRICLKDQNNRIKKVLNNIDTKMNLKQMRNELEQLKVMSSEYEFLDGDLPYR